MANLNIANTRDRLQRFEFGPLFIEELGWSQPTMRRPIPVAIGDWNLQQREIAELGGIVVFEVTAAGGDIPDATTRAALDRAISKQFHEHLLIFVDAARTQSLWYWVKRDSNKHYPRDHYYFRGQPGDLFLSKLGAMFFDLSDLDEAGHVSVVEVAQRIQKALDIQRVTKRFYNEYEDEHVAFTELIEGIDDDHDRRWYASVLLNRLMFIYFLQRRLFLDRGDANYLRTKLIASKQRGKDRYYRDFIVTLFFEGFAKPEDNRSAETNALLGNIKYLNGGLFIPHKIEAKWKGIRVPDAAFENLLALFERYSWNLNDTPGGKDDEINPDVLGYIFEKYINQKAFGAYYTRPEITEYLSEQTIHRLILDKVNRPGVPGLVEAREFDSIADLLLHLDAPLCRELLFDILPKLSLLDPACGSGAFLIAAMKVLIAIYSAIAGKVEYLNDGRLSDWLRQAKTEHRSLSYYLKKQIITDNLIGVDIMEEAVEIARLRLFLALVGSVQTVEQLEPLPNIDFNILVGNSLIGLLRVNEQAYDARASQGNMFQKPYHEIVAEKDRLIRSYRDASSYAEDLRALRDKIDEHRAEATAELDDILLDEFEDLGIQYAEYAWDAKKGEVSKKRSVRINDIRALHPFHWGYEFAEIMNERGGFDGIITNPPWEIFQTDEKEFFGAYSDVIQKKKMSILDFIEKRDELLKGKDLREAWLEYSSKFPYQNAYFRKAPQYVNQISTFDGKIIPGKINLFKLFVEQSFNLLRNEGRCGIVIPSSIYTDADKKQLREMLFDHTTINGLICFENHQPIFDGVDSRFKFVVLSFEKGGHTSSFPAAFMRRDVAELAYFPGERSLYLPISLIKRSSPDSYAITEFKSEMDIRVAGKLVEFPLVGETLGDKWNLQFTTEFDKTATHDIYELKPANKRLPLYEGAMIHHFTHVFNEPKYFIDERKGRERLSGKSGNSGQIYSYQEFRLVHRRVTNQTNERTLIATVIPPNCFCDNSMNYAIPGSCSKQYIVFACAVFCSFVFDWQVRGRINSNVTIGVLNQLSVPRLTINDKAFAPIVERAAKLICTTPEFDDLAKEVGLKSHRDGVTDPKQRARLRAELDGMIAHLYGLTEDEFSHILATFPLVEQSVKDATLEAYRTGGK